MLQIPVGISENRAADATLGWWSGFSDISGCGRYACVCLADPRAFVDPARNQWEQMAAALARFRDQALRSRVMLIDCTTGTVMADIAVPFWVTHLNMHPDDPWRAVINMEGGNVGQRIWRLDLRSSALEPLFPQLGDEWTCHECWDPQGRCIVYHGGKRAGGQAYVERRTYDGALIARRSADGVSFAHATLSADGASYLIDCVDGLIRRWGIDGGDLEVLCRHDSDYRDQDAHPHPRSVPGGGSLIFTSCREGACNVYEVGLRGDEDAAVPGR